MYILDSCFKKVKSLLLLFNVLTFHSVADFLEPAYRNEHSAVCTVKLVGAVTRRLHCIGTLTASC